MKTSLSFCIRKSMLLLLIFLSIGCTSSVYLSVLQPAPVYVGDHIKTIALVNRTKPADKRMNIIEGVLTGEGIYQDKSGVDNLISGLRENLQNSPRFEVVTTNLYLPGSGAGNVFPEALNWSEIHQICKTYKADAVIALETFDTDNLITPSKRVVEKKDKEGKTYNVTEYVVEQQTIVKAGIRFYDPQNKNIFDQLQFNEQMHWSETAASEKEAVARLLLPKEASSEVSYAAGARYSRRISPSWIRVQRPFYRKGSNAMERAARLADVNDWEGAAKSWESISKYEKRKTAGRAAYNYAIACEVLGKLDEAKEWAQKAYSHYGEKKGREYIHIINGRIRDRDRLDHQMNSAQGNIN